MFKPDGSLGSRSDKPPEQPGRVGDWGPWARYAHLRWGAGQQDGGPGKTGLRPMGEAHWPDYL